MARLSTTWILPARQADDKLAARLARLSPFAGMSSDCTVEAGTILHGFIVLDLPHLIYSGFTIICMVSDVV